MASETVLFIVEGQKDEPNLIKAINKALYYKDKIDIYSYNTSIYELYDKLLSEYDFDDHIDFPLILRSMETDWQKRELLSKNFSAIYLIFDFEPHYPKFNIENLIRLQKYFNDSLDKGLLLINYPMLEAFRHLKQLPDKDFLTKTVTKEEVKRYKELVNNESNLQNLACYYNEDVKKIIIHHLIKLNIFFNGKKEVPNFEEVQAMVCDSDFTKKQFQNYQDDKLIVLSMIFYYIIEMLPKSFYQELDLPIIKLLTGVKS